MSDIAWIDENNPEFPDSRFALEEPNGLLAAGGTLNKETLLKAYSKGIFPWYSDPQPVLWWSPSPRTVLEPAEIHHSRTLKKLAKKKLFEISENQNFSDVLDACASIPRSGQDGTWITEEIRESYIDLHNSGYAHSIEAWHEGRLVGGLYGVALGKVFFGESMFSLYSGASKIAFSTLVEQLKVWNFELIDCQIHTAYLESFGAHEISRNDFEKKLEHAFASYQIEKPANLDDQHKPISAWGTWTQAKHGYDANN